MTAPKNDVLIVEDVREIGRRLAAVIDELPGFSVCAIARSVREATGHLADHRPRIVLVDLGLPDGSGIEVIHSARQAEWVCDCLVISTFGDEKRVLSALQAGARGYLLKGDGPPKFDEVLHAILEGGSPISPKVARFLLKLVDGGPQLDDVCGVEMSLTQRETEILQAIKRGYKRKEIADSLQISVGTVGVHINKVYRKLEVGSNVEAILAATKRGLI